MTKLQFLKVIVSAGILVSAGDMINPDLTLASSTPTRSIAHRLKAIRERFDQASPHFRELHIGENQASPASKSISQYYWPNWGNWPNWNNWRNWVNWGNWGNF
jgi:hypothetical protein